MSFRCKECGKIIMSFTMDTCPQCIAKGQMLRDEEWKRLRERQARSDRMRNELERDAATRRALTEENDRLARIRRDEEVRAADEAFFAMMLMNTSTQPPAGQPASVVYSYSDPSPVTPAFSESPKPFVSEVSRDDTPAPSYSCRDDSSSYSSSYDSSSSYSSSSDSGSSCGGD